MRPRLDRVTKGNCLRALAVAILLPLALQGAAGQDTPGARDMLLKPEPGLGLEQGLDFVVGQSVFEKIWVPAPTATRSSDGLGPLYNARSCVQCHVRNGRGRVPEPGDKPVALLMKVGHWVSGAPDPVYGHQLQAFAIVGQPAEYALNIDYQPVTRVFRDGRRVELQSPEYSLSQLAYGPLGAETVISPRLAPPLVGMGPLARVRDRAIIALADPDDENGDGISGRVNQVANPLNGQVSIGRFGYKAQIASLTHQVESAMHHDLGLSTPLYPDGSGDCMPSQQICFGAPNGNSPEAENLEVPSTLVKLVEYYVSHLAVPPQRDVKTPRVRSGERLFVKTGCDACHTPEYTPEALDGIDSRAIRPYTDLLLHDMGPGLADALPQGQATGSEWRTAPLWGIGLAQKIDETVDFLHDGRARTLEEAILWHDGEARSAREAYQALGAEQREQLIAFIESL